jgi:hypothetical protein
VWSKACCPELGTLGMLGAARAANGRANMEAAKQLPKVAEGV